jgi:hypothetical protein
MQVPAVRHVARASDLDFYVAVAVVGEACRYVAFADVAGDIELGFGTSTREAIDDVLTREFGAQTWSHNATDS